jgi:Glycosyl transferases group 1
MPIVCYVGNFSPPWSTENDVRKAFEHLGWQVACMQEQKASWQDIRDSAFQSDLLLWTSTWDDAQPFEESIDTLKRCALRGIPTATLHLDIFHGLSRDNRRWWMNPQFYTQYVFTADGDHEEEWKELGVNHHWLKPAIRHDAAHFGKVRKEYECDVAFLGSNGEGYHEGEWPYRKELLRQLRSMCQKNGWSFRNPGGDEPKIDRSEDRNDFYASAKVTVGDSLCLNKEKSKYCSDRVYEATGCGGLLIMPEIEFVDKDFNGLLPIYPWSDWAHLEDAISYLLENDSMNQSARKSCQAITAQNHTYVNRVKELLKCVLPS